VIGHDVENLPETECFESRSESRVRRLAAQLEIYCAPIDRIVAVGAARGGLHVRRRIDVGDAERGEIIQLARGVIQREAAVHLETISGFGKRPRGLHFSSHEQL